MEKDDILHLSKLARIKIDETEAEKLTADIDAVLKYVSVVNEIAADSEVTKKVGAVYNVFREDEVTNTNGEQTETLLQEAPERTGAYVKVKKILQAD